MRSPETTGFRSTLHRTLTLCFAVLLSLAGTASLRADQVVYFVKGKAIVVKSVEKGPKFTVLELEGGGKVGVPTEQIERIDDVVEASGVQTPVPGVTMMTPPAPASGMQTPVAQATTPTAVPLSPQAAAALQGAPIIPAGGGLPVLPFNRPTAQAPLGPGTGNRYAGAANGMGGAPALNRGGQGSGAPFMTARASQMAQGGPAIGGPGRGMGPGMSGPMGRGRPGPRQRGRGPAPQAPAAAAQQPVAQPAQGSTPAPTQPAQSQGTPSQTESAPPAHVSEPSSAEPEASDADAYAADDDGEPADSASP